MTASRIRLALIPILLLCVACVATAPPAAEEAAADGSLAAKLDAAARRLSFAGSVLVVADGDVVLHRGYGRDPSGRPIEPETPFWIASISKQFTAAAILRLRDAGLVSLDNPISDFFETVPPDKQAITVRQLLLHTSGLGQNYAADGIAGRSAAVATILARPLDEAPGQKFRYSNDNYSLLAALVEIASGRSFEEYLRDEMFAPARMTKTVFWGETAEGMAVISRPPSAAVMRPNWGFRGATGIGSTAGDLRAWTEALRRGTILSSASAAEMMRGVIRVGESTRHGYGWFTSTEEGRETLWTRGYEDMGHGGYVSVDPDWRWTVVVLSAAGIPRGSEKPLTHLLGPALEAIVREELKDRGPVDGKVVQAIASRG